MSRIHLEEFHTRWLRLWPLSNETLPHVIREQHLSKLRWIKEKEVDKETKNSQGSCVVDFSGLDPSPGRASFEKELGKYCAQRCTTVPKIVCFVGSGVMCDGKDPYLLKWVLQLDKKPHTNRHNVKVEKHRPRLNPEDIYALAYKDFFEDRSSQTSQLRIQNNGDLNQSPFSPQNCGECSY